ncbi:response regulator [Candidatus Falkowbacteria bacterium]|nr:response regulator [Candidatus Falkowbacteria bacterium]
MKKILIAEDESALSRALELKLQNLGFDVKIATDGEEALAFLQTEVFDLVLLDLMMPKRDGFGVMSERTSWKSQPVVFINSNLSQKADVDKAKAMGADDFLVKSDISLKGIVEKINSTLKK